MQDALLPRNAITVVRGSSKTIELTIRKNGRPLDLTGKLLHFTVATHRYRDAAQAAMTDQEDTPLIYKRSGTGYESQIFIDPLTAAQGRADIKLTPADTTNPLALPGDYLYDVWVEDPETGDQYPAVEPTTFQIRAGVRLP